MMREKNLKFGGKLHKKGKPPRFGGGRGGAGIGKNKDIWAQKVFKIQHLGRKRDKITKLVGEKRAKATKLGRGKE